MPVLPPAPGSVFGVHVTPKSAKNELLGWETDAAGKPWLKVKIAAPPEDGKANKELLRFLAKTWRIPKSCISLLSGDTSRHKRLKIGEY